MLRVGILALAYALICPFELPFKIQVITPKAYFFIPFCIDNPGSFTYRCNQEGGSYTSQTGCICYLSCSKYASCFYLMLQSYLSD